MRKVWLKFSKIRTGMFRNLTFLSFLSGFLLATICYFYVEDNYEKQIFKALASEVQKNLPDSFVDNEDSILIATLHLTHYLGERRANIFKDIEISAWKSNYIHPVTFDLMTTKGACGSYAFILGRLLNELKIPIRFAQMRVSGIYGGHNVIEAKTNHGWVVLDPTYDLYYTRPDGKLASFADVGNDWPRYKNQVPLSYDMAYSYEGVRYTNWNKIPIIMPLAKRLMYITLGKETTDSYSFRNLILRKFHLLLFVAVFFYLLVTFHLIRQVWRKKMMAAVKVIKPQPVTSYSTAIPGIQQRG